MRDRPAASDSYRAVLIGIDAYPSQPLGGCVNDIDEIEDLLLERLRVPPERITRLTAPRQGTASSGRLPSSMPTLEALRGCLTGLAERATAEERVFLYYSGHGAQVRTQTAGVVVAREALVPVDVASSGGGWLYDFEINSLLARIADRAADLTLVLDCCHAGSVTRGAEPGMSGQVRHYEATQIEALASGSPMLRSSLPVRDAAGIGAREADWMVVAACRANETAREVPMSAATPDQFQGALTHVLVELLRSVEPQRLPDIKWADLWPAMLAGVDRLSSGQHPNLLGRGERRVFGGSWAPRDLGYLILPEAGNLFKIKAGSLTGITPGALVGVYGQEPDLFPPLHSASDLAARRGVLRVVEASRSEAKGEATAGFELPANPRGRLLEPGRADRLVVALEPFDPSLAGVLAPLEVMVLPTGTAASEAELELRREGTDLVLCDEVHDDRRDPDLAPLLRIPVERADYLMRALRHYARYNNVLRLARRCLDLPGAMRVTFLDGSGLPRLAPTELADPSLSEVNRASGGTCTVREGAAFVIRVENRSSLVLHVSVFNCTGSGRVEYLGNETLAPWSPRIFWQNGRVGEPFAPSVATPSAAAVDRIVVVATTNAGVDLSHLELPQPIADILTRDASRDALRDATSSPVAEQWTALQVPLLITRW
jgi:Caspase domain